MSNSWDWRDVGGESETPLVLSVAEASAGAGAEVMVFDTVGMDNPAGGEPVMLELADLLPDASGEVVLFADDELPVNIVTDQSISEVGIAEAHVTATGVDVTGLHFYSFESGLTVYSPIDVLIIADPDIS